MIMNIEQVLKNIKKARINKEFSYENMGFELNISHSAYEKIEKNKTKLSLERLFKISEILEVSLAKLLDIKHTNQLNQTNNENATGYLQQIENSYHDNKDKTDKIVQLYEERLKDKDEIIAFLKKRK